MYMSYRRYTHTHTLIGSRKYMLYVKSKQGKGKESNCIGTKVSF